MTKENKRKLDGLLNQINAIMNSRIVVAGFVILDGVNFIINPFGSMEFMAMIIAGFAIIAAISLLLTNMKTKTKDLKSTIIAIIMIIAGLNIFIFPKFFGRNIRVLVAIFIILNGLINIFNIFKLDKIAASISYAENKLIKRFESEDENKTYNKKIILEQANKFINPINDVIGKISVESIIYLIFNIISVILGILLFTNDNITIFICGFILIYTGIFDIFMYLKSRKLARRISK